MILKTRQKHRIPLSVMDAIICDVQSLFDIAIGELSSQIQTHLQQLGVTQEVARSIDSIFTNFPRVFEGLQTQQQQLAFFRSNFNFIVMHAYRLIQYLLIGSSELFWGKSKNLRATVQKEEL